MNLQDNINSHKKYKCICNHRPFAKKESLQKHLKSNKCKPKKTGEERNNYLKKTHSRKWPAPPVIKVVPKKLTDEDKFKLASNFNPLVYNCSINQNYTYIMANLESSLYNGKRYQWLCELFTNTFKDIILISSQDKNIIMIRYQVDKRIKINRYNWSTLLTNIFEPFINELYDFDKVKNGKLGDKPGWKTFIKELKKYKLNTYASFKQYVLGILKPLLLTNCSDKYYQNISLIDVLSPATALK